MRLRAKMVGIPFTAVLTVIFLFFGFNSSATAETVRKIKIGLALSFTGPVAATTKPESEGTLDMTWWVNEKLGGWKFRNPKTGNEEIFKYDVMWEDVGYSAPKNIATYNRFLDAKTDLIICLTTLGAASMAPLAARDRMPVIGGSATPATAQVLPRYLTLLATGYPDYFGAALNWISKERPGAKVGIIAADISFGRSFDIPEVKAHAKKLGLTLLPIVYIPYPTFSDATVELKRMDGMKPDIIYVQDLAGRAAIIANDAIKLGLWKKYQWMMSNLCLPGMFMDLTGNKAIGAYGLYFLADPLSHPDKKGVKIMREVFKEKGRKGSLGYEGLYQLSGTGIPVASKMLQISLEKYGYPLTPEQTVWGFDNLRGYNWGDMLAYPPNPSKERPVIVDSTFIYRIDGPNSRPVVGKAKCPAITPFKVSKKAVWE